MPKPALHPAMRIAYMIMVPVGALEALMFFAFQDSPGPMPLISLYALSLLLLPSIAFVAGRITSQRNHRRASSAILWFGILFAASPLLLVFIAPYARFAAVLFRGAFN